MDNKNINDLFDSKNTLDLILNNDVLSIKDNDGKVIFQKEYDKRRVICSVSLIKVLIENNQINEFVVYCKNNEYISFITLFDSKVQKSSMINVYFSEDASYFVPFKYSDSENLIDNKMHYTEKASIIDRRKDRNVKSTEIIYDMSDIELGTISSPNSKNKYIPLFKSLEELSKLYKNEEYGICKISYEESLEFAKKYNGLVFGPTEESFIIENSIASIFSSVTPLSEINIDYKRVTENEKTIQSKIRRLKCYKIGSPKFTDYYNGILQSINSLSKIYIALSQKEFNPRLGTSVPFIGNKDGKTSIFIFTEKKYADKWTKIVNNYTKSGVPLIGELSITDDYNYIFAMADRLHVKICTVDDEAGLFLFNLNSFTKLNWDLNKKIRIKILKSEVDKNSLSNNRNRFNLRFNPIKVCYFKNLIPDPEYVDYYVSIK